MSLAWAQWTTFSPRQLFAPIWWAPRVKYIFIIIINVIIITIIIVFIRDNMMNTSCQVTYSYLKWFSHLTQNVKWCDMYLNFLSSFSSNYHSIIPQVFPTVTSCQFPTGSLTGRKGQGLKKILNNLQMCQEKPQHVQTAKCENNHKVWKIVLKMCKWAKSNDGVHARDGEYRSRSLCSLSQHRQW